MLGNEMQSNIQQIISSHCLPFNLQYQVVKLYVHIKIDICLRPWPLCNWLASFVAICCTHSQSMQLFCNAWSSRPCSLWDSTDFPHNTWNWYRCNSVLNIPQCIAKIEMAQLYIIIMCFCIVNLVFKHKRTMKLCLPPTPTHTHTATTHIMYARKLTLSC